MTCERVSFSLPPYVRSFLSGRARFVYSRYLHVLPPSFPLRTTTRRCSCLPAATTCPQAALLSLSQSIMMLVALSIMTAFLMTCLFLARALMLRGVLAVEGCVLRFVFLCGTAVQQPWVRSSSFVVVHTYINTYGRSSVRVAAYQTTPSHSSTGARQEY